LGESHRQRLLEALRERDAARLELQRVSDARLHAERRLEKVTEVLHRATSNGGPRPVGGDGVEEQHVSELRDELAIAIARANSAERRLADVDQARSQLGESVEGLRDAAAAAESRVRQLESELDAATREHEQHAVDLQATHAATAAELASASARAEHLATECEVA